MEKRNVGKNLNQTRLSMALNDLPSTPIGMRSPRRKPIKNKPGKIVYLYTKF